MVLFIGRGESIVAASFHPSEFDAHRMKRQMTDNGERAWVSVVEHENDATIEELTDKTAVESREFSW
jgi:hypothetical protein